jgi:hypothetical protein
LPTLLRTDSKRRAAIAPYVASLLEQRIVIFS